MSSKSSRGALAVLLAALAGIVVLALPAAASARDRNHDRIPDRWEKHYRLSLKVSQAHRNQDGDKLKNRQEFRAGTNPRKADTNGDGVDDGDDISGTIASFDGTTLTIDLFAGGTASGQVTDATEITCDNGDNGDDDGDNGDTGDGDGGAGGDVVAHNDGSDDEGTCTTADLVPHAVVDEAQLDDTGTVFTEIDLATAGDED
jgi:hypothetical protein